MTDDSHDRSRASEQIARDAMKDALASVGLSISEHSSQAGASLQITLDDSAYLEVGFYNQLIDDPEYVVTLHSPDEDDGRWIASFALDQADHAAALCLAIFKETK